MKEESLSLLPLSKRERSFINWADAELRLTIIIQLSEKAEARLLSKEQFYQTELIFFSNIRFGGKGRGQRIFFLGRSRVPQNTEGAFSKEHFLAARVWQIVALDCCKEALVCTGGGAAAAASFDK